MSFFAVTIETIEKVEAHFNADKLEVVSLSGREYKIVVSKGRWQVGQTCLYYPIDAVLPEKIQENLGVVGRLAGNQKNRIKSVNIRGIISQGLIGDLLVISDLPDSLRTPEQITKYLNIIKYEPEIPASLNMKGTLVDLPEGVGIYDIENSENYREIVNELMNLPVVITEKIEGSHIAITARENEVLVSQRRFGILNDQGHLFWDTAVSQGLTTLATEILKEQNAKQVTLRGEIIGPGIQCNIYRLLRHFITVYDITVDSYYLDHESFEKIFSTRNRLSETAPVIAKNIALKEWLNGRSLVEASNGNSILPQQLGLDTVTLREGIVIKPMHHLHYPDFGRVILKQISPEYLAKQES
jgi:RNA ligase (TIGR02306 family)